MFIYFIILGIVLFLFCLSILCVFFYNLKKQVKSCRNCVCLNENNYCSYLKKTVKDLDKINCEGIIL